MSLAFDRASPITQINGKWLDNDPKATEEKVLVTVRLRPLTSKELAKGDFSAWERSDEKTITLTHPVGEKTSFPPSYRFDQVFGTEATTKEVYEKGVKDVAISSLIGKNATIFAYGQTCSGKTYTMQGVTEFAVDDIYSHIKQNDDRTFVLKFSALEIYNELVNDLLNPESGPLRLLDDPSESRDLLIWLVSTFATELRCRICYGHWIGL